MNSLTVCPFVPGETYYRSSLHPESCKNDIFPGIPDDAEIPGGVCVFGGGASMEAAERAAVVMVQIGTPSK